MRVIPGFKGRIKMRLIAGFIILCAASLLPVITLFYPSRILRIFSYPFYPLIVIAHNSLLLFIVVVLASSYFSAVFSAKKKINIFKGIILNYTLLVLISISIILVVIAYNNSLARLCIHDSDCEFSTGRLPPVIFSRTGINLRMPFLHDSCISVLTPRCINHVCRGERTITEYKK